MQMKNEMLINSDKALKPETSVYKSLNLYCLLVLSSHWLIESRTFPVVDVAGCFTISSNSTHHPNRELN